MGKSRLQRPLSTEPQRSCRQAHDASDELDVAQARTEVERFLGDHRAVAVWSNEFFRRIVDRIEVV